jgi:hypothetical protein
LAITYVTPVGHLASAGSCQAGSLEVDIFGLLVDILTVGTLNVDIGTYLVQL